MASDSKTEQKASYYIGTKNRPELRCCGQFFYGRLGAYTLDRLTYEAGSRIIKIELFHHLEQMIEGGVDMHRVLKSKEKVRTFLGGMSKVFDWKNTKSLYGRKRSFSSVMMYGKQKTDAERLSEDWLALGSDFSMVMAEAGEMHGK